MVFTPYKEYLQSGEAPSRDTKELAAWTKNLGHESGLDRAHPLELLLHQIAEGEAAAFEDFYVRTAKHVFGLSLKVVRTHDLAADVAQDVYLQVWTSADRYNPALGTPFAWLFTLTHRRAVDALRHEQGCRERESRYHRETSQLGQKSTDELVLRRLVDEEVLRSLSAISEHQSEAIVLAYFNGQKYAEVARTLNVSLPAVKSRIRDGLSNLRRTLGPAVEN